MSTKAITIRRSRAWLALNADRPSSIRRQRLPPGVTPAYFEGFLRRNRPALVAVLDRQLTARATRYPAGTESPRSSGDRYADAYAQPPDLWAASQRTAANLAAMRLAASKRPDEMSAQDRAALARPPPEPRARRGRR